MSDTKLLPVLCESTKQEFEARGIEPSDYVERAAVIQAGGPGCETTPGTAIAQAPRVEVLKEQPEDTPFYKGRKFPLDGVMFEITDLTASGFIATAAALTNKGRHRVQATKQAATEAQKRAKSKAKSDTRPEGEIVGERYAQATDKAEKRKALKKARREAERLLRAGDARSREEIIEALLNPAPQVVTHIEIIGDEVTVTQEMPGAILAEPGSEAQAHV